MSSALPIPSPKMALHAKSSASDVLDSMRPNLPDYCLRGATAVVTGGNSGIGLESVRTLVEAGCKVVLCSRSVAAGEAALESVGLAGNPSARVQKLDLADLRSVEAAASAIAGTDDDVSLLLNNAGVMATPRLETQQGFELQIGTNHLGHFALTRLLLPHLSADARVINVASSAHAMGGVDPTDLNFATRKYKPWTAYGASKAANILFAKGLADRLASADSQVLSVSLHPGVIATPLWRHGNRLLTWLLHKIIIDKDVSQGAATSIYAAFAPRDALPPGSYLADCAVATPNEACIDADKTSRAALWSSSEALLEAAGCKLPAGLFGK